MCCAISLEVGLGFFGYRYGSRQGQGKVVAVV